MGYLHRSGLYLRLQTSKEADAGTMMGSIHKVPIDTFTILPLSSAAAYPKIFPAGSLPCRERPMTGGGGGGRVLLCLRGSPAVTCSGFSHTSPHLDGGPRAAGWFAAWALDDQQRRRLL